MNKHNLHTNSKLSSSIYLIKKSINIFFEKRNFIFFVKIYLPLLPFQILFFLQNLFVKSQSLSMNDSTLVTFNTKFPWFMPVVIGVNLIFMAVSFWVELAGIKSIIGIVGGKNKSTKDNFSFAWKNLLSFSLLSICFGLIQIGGLILLVFPGIVFSVWFGFSKFIFITQGMGIKKSFIESKKVIGDRFWAILGRIFVFIIFTFIVQIIFSMIPFGVGTIVSAFFGALLILPYYLLYKEISD